MSVGHDRAATHMLLRFFGRNRAPATLAELDAMPGRGWHSLRRKFASDLMDQPQKVLCKLGGWKMAKTVLQCYQRLDVGQLRQALEDRRPTDIRIAGAKQPDPAVEHVNAIFARRCQP